MSEPREARPRDVRRRLSGRILTLTLLPMLLAIGVSVLLVDAQVRRLTEQEIESQLAVARSLALDLLAARESDLLEQGWVVARDPKFFAMLVATDVERGEEFRRTLQELARQFAVTLGSDQLEILDEQGRIQASWESPGITGSGTLPRDASREPDVASALTGSASAQVRRGLAGKIVQTAAVPVVVGGRLVGVLRHGDRIDTELLGRIRNLTRCEVAFVVGDEAEETTLLTGDSQHLTTDAVVPAWVGARPLEIRLYRSIEPELRFLGELRLQLLLIGLGGVAGGLVAARVLVGRITGPIGQLVRAAIRLERGEEDSPVEIDTGDELEYLGRRFREMRAALRSQITALEGLDRMKSTFLTLVSHELRTPATIIQGSVDLLELAPAPADRGFPEILESLRNGVGRLQALLERVGDMALLDGSDMRLSMRAVHASEILGDLARSFHRMRKGRALELEVAPAEDAWIRADAGRLLQALGHVVHNAIRFTPDGGRIRIEVRIDGRRVRFCVEDSGVGISPEHGDRIFEAFYEGQDVLAHRSGDEQFGSGGLGLGLALARGIVEAHGGTIRHEPVETGGSRFLVELPAAEGQNAPGLSHRAAA